MCIPLYMARDSQRALELLLRDCSLDPACRQRFPALGERLDRLLNRLGARPQRVRVTHPRTGAEVEIDVKRSTIASVLFAALYSPQTAALLPLLIERAEKGDFQGFLALGSASDGLAENMSVGMQFSVLCSEDAPRIGPGDIQRETAGALPGRPEARLPVHDCRSLCARPGAPPL